MSLHSGCMLCSTALLRVSPVDSLLHAARLAHCSLKGCMAQGHQTAACSDKDRCDCGHDSGPGEAHHRGKACLEVLEEPHEPVMHLTPCTAPHAHNASFRLPPVITLLMPMPCGQFWQLLNTLCCMHAQVVDWLEEHYGDQDPKRVEQIKKRFQKHDPSADLGL